jgi:hypothetical protein
MNYSVHVNSIQFLYLSACQQLVAYNRRATEVYVTKATLRLELESDQNLILGNKIVQVTQEWCNSVGLNKGKCILKGDVYYIINNCNDAWKFKVISEKSNEVGMCISRN